MRKEDEVIKRLVNYKNNLGCIREEHGKNVIKQAIIELSWILGEESNYEFKNVGEIK